MGDVWKMVEEKRRGWPLTVQARHAVRFPDMWTNVELARLVAEIKQEGK